MLRTSRTNTFMSLLANIVTICGICMLISLDLLNVNLMAGSCFGECNALWYLSFGFTNSHQNLRNNQQKLEPNIFLQYQVDIPLVYSITKLSFLFQRGPHCP